MTSRFPSSWSPKKLDDLGFVGRGKSKHRPRNDPILYGGKYPFFQTSDVKNVDLYLKKYSQTYNEIGLAQSKLWKPDTLLITIAANIAETAILGIEGCFPDSIVGFVADPTKADVRFIKYYIDFIKIQMQNISRGTTQDNLSLDKLLSFDFYVPKIEIQTKIAEALSQYDELIELHSEQIELLEDLIQSLYHEWIVKLNFPGHENSSMVESDLGLIPTDWKAMTVGELLDFHIGGGWGKEKPDKKHTASAYVIRGTDIPRARHVTVDDCPLRFHKPSNFKPRQLRAGDVMLEVSGGSKNQLVGRALLITQQLLNMLGNNVICASFCKLLRVNNNRLLPELLYLHLLEIYNNGQISKYQVQSTGITNFKFAFFLQGERLVVPSRKLQGQFAEIVKPILHKIQTLGKETAFLRKARNLLLPRLISGEIQLSKSN